MKGRKEGTKQARKEGNVGRNKERRSLFHVYKMTIVLYIVAFLELKETKHIFLLIMHVLASLTGNIIFAKYGIFCNKFVRNEGKDNSIFYLCVVACRFSNYREGIHGWSIRILN